MYTRGYFRENDRWMNGSGHSGIVPGSKSEK